MREIRPPYYNDARPPAIWTATVRVCSLFHALISDLQRSEDFTTPVHSAGTHSHSERFANSSVLGSTCSSHLRTGSCPCQARSDSARSGIRQLRIPAPVGRRCCRCPESTRCHRARFSFFALPPQDLLSPALCCSTSPCPMSSKIQPSEACSSLQRRQDHFSWPSASASN